MEPVEGKRACSLKSGETSSIYPSHSLATLSTCPRTIEMCRLGRACNGKHLFPFLGIECRIDKTVLDLVSIKASKVTVLFLSNGHQTTDLERGE